MVSKKIDGDSYHYNLHKNFRWEWKIMWSMAIMKTEIQFMVSIELEKTLTNGSRANTR